MKNASFVRVESGKFKGKRLFLPSFATTRSTKSRVKACVFNTLRAELAGKVFVEVFGGSGAMAFEALSNDALGVVVVEKDKNAYKIACQNAALLLNSTNSLNSSENSLLKHENSVNSNANSPLKDENSTNLQKNTLNSSPNYEFTSFAAQKVRLYQGDSFELLPSILEQMPRQTPIIAYFDPPFHHRKGFLDIYERVFGLINSLKGLNLWLFIIEHSSQMPMPKAISLFKLYKEKKFGNTALSFYRL